jgi:hypothetical protein
MKQMHPLASGEEGTSHKVEWATGSLIRALPSGIRKFASSHAHGYMSDETAHQAGAEATINIVKPAVKADCVCIVGGPRVVLEQLSGGCMIAIKHSLLMFAFT